jgi:hypothetical protein
MKIARMAKMAVIPNWNRVTMSGIFGLQLVTLCGMEKLKKRKI